MSSLSLAVTHLLPFSTNRHLGNSHYRDLECAREIEMAMTHSNRARSTVLGSKQLLVPTSLGFVNGEAPWSKNGNN